MAATTDVTLRNQTMYCIFLRQFTPEGTFAAAERELDRIRALGTDVIWLMPIHPLGKQARKGSLGSPYANQDYRTVNPEYGTLEDFIHFCNETHARGMKVMIDVVYNHTSPDSVLAAEHPEWFYHKPDGSFGNRIGDWTDIIDLDYANKELWRYQIDTLKYWAQWVDGFRCDVAPIVPLAFWEQAREEVEAVHPGCLWLSESAEPGFIMYLRSLGRPGHSDAEEYRAFDLCYEYDIYHEWVKALQDDASLDIYLELLNRQESTYDDRYVKLRFLENHDRSRAAFLIPDPCRLRNWTAFNGFKKGMMFIYNGQERSADFRPSLFDPDPIDWTGEDLSPLLTRLSEIRRDPVMTGGMYRAEHKGHGMILAEYGAGDEQLVGIFSVRGCRGCVRVSLKDGEYTDLLSGKKVRVEEGRLSCQGEPMILKAGEGRYFPG